jgi:DivIVA domain
VSTPEFRRAVRGYDPDEVNRFVRDLTERVERLEEERAEAERTEQRLTREIKDANDRAERGKPSFAELGSAFEETLRLAEAQSQKIVQEASQEAAEVLASARSESTRVREEAAKETRNSA